MAINNYCSRNNCYHLKEISVIYILQHRLPLSDQHGTRTAFSKWLQPSASARTRTKMVIISSTSWWMKILMSETYQTLSIYTNSVKPSRRKTEFIQLTSSPDSLPMTTAPVLSMPMTYEQLRMMLISNRWIKLHHEQLRMMTGCHSQSQWSISSKHYIENNKIAFYIHVSASQQLFARVYFLPDKSYHHSTSIPQFCCCVSHQSVISSVISRTYFKWYFKWYSRHLWF